VLIQLIPAISADGKPRPEWSKKRQSFRTLRKAAANRGQPIFDMFPEARLDPSIPIGFTPRAKRFGVGPAMSAFRKPTARHCTDRLRTALSRAGAEPGPERLLRPRLACQHFLHRTVRRSG